MPEPVPEPAIDGSFRSGPPLAPSPAPPPLPPRSWAPLGDPDGWEQVWLQPGGEVWRSTAGEPRYLKVGRDDAAQRLVAEHDRIRWLGRLGGDRPATPAWAEVATHEIDPFPAALPELGVGPVAGELGWLVVPEVPGIPAHDRALAGVPDEQLAAALGRGLRRFHDALPVDACRFDHRIDHELASARRRVALGRLDTSALPVPYRGRPPGELVDYAEDIRPPEPVGDLVVAHGDAGLPNLLLDPATGEVCGLVDLGRVGVSDRYRDLAVLSRSWVANRGPEQAWVLFEAYGLDRPDLARLEFHALLDELW